MLPLFLLLLAADPAPASTAADAVKIGGPVKVGKSDIILPVGDSLRAAAWENLIEKPTAPRHVGLACLVIANEGTPVSCVPATPKLKAANIGQWNALVDAYSASAPPTPTPERSLNEIATLRVLNSRVRPERGSKGKTNWKVMIFDEVFAPTDARPHPPAGEALPMSAVTLTKSFDPDILRMLYPLAAERYRVAARVTITCHIEPTLTLLCREPGKIEAEQGEAGEGAAMIYTSLVLASYQAASTIRLAPKAKDGSDVVGKDLTMSFRWALPPGETPPAVPAVAVPPAPVPAGR